MSCIIDSLLFLLNQLAQWYHTLTAPKYQAATRKSPLSSSTIYYVHWCDLVESHCVIPLPNILEQLVIPRFLAKARTVSRAVEPSHELTVPAFPDSFPGALFLPSTCAFCAPVLCSFKHTWCSFTTPWVWTHFFLLFRMASFLLYSLLESAYSFFKIQLND